ncbi:redoxin family protein [Fulvivirgaceae bacterium BMA10]|uniref:Redoxin family protein n=1 Tax=Splendidivirga corallicola TaxID=3051826 RepID=A0ABT8KSC3_9BACT|nr:redoxin family protein [Fulvivirgaceae bacterium BMA10]
MKLQTGTSLPAFSTIDVYGNTISSEKLRGKKILISFFRGASCPFCNLHIRDILRSNLNTDDLTMVFFFTSSQEEILQHTNNSKTNFRLIADPNLKYYNLFGIEKSRAGMFKAMFRIKRFIRIFSEGLFSMRSMMDIPTVPADFLINEQGNIERVYYGKDYGDHLPIDEIRRWVGKPISLG